MSLARFFIFAASTAAFSGVAAAACPALPAPVIAPGDGLLSVEGPVSAIDLVDRTVTVVGTCINIPATMLIDTSFDGIGDITLDQLVTGGATSPIGGTMIIDADVTTDVLGNVVYTATNPYFDFGEHVVVGPLISVDPLTSSFVVGHSTIIMNTDARLPSNLWDLGGNSMTIADMVGWEGSVVTAQGYFAGGVINATTVETMVIVPVAGSDTVSIFKADYRASKRSVDVRGQTTAHSVTGAYAASVNIDLACDGTVENVAAVIVDPATGLGDWRWVSGNNVSAANPGTVCVTSPLGGTATRTFVVR